MEGPPQSKGRCRTGQQAASWPHAETDEPTDSNGSRLVQTKSDGVRLRDGTLDEPARGDLIKKTFGVTFSSNYLAGG